MLSETDMISAEFRGHEFLLQRHDSHGCEQYIFKPRQQLGRGATRELVAKQGLMAKWAI